MAPEPNGRPSWVKDVGVFCGMAVLNIVLSCPCGYLYGWNLGKGPADSSFYEGWLWVFAFPVMFALEYGGGGPHYQQLFLLNPIIYGLIGWSAWRMFRLMRSKPPRD